MTRRDLLLREFPAPSSAQWEQRAAAERKGRPVDELAWRTDDGFALPALVRPGGALPHLGSAAAAALPGPAPAIRQRIDAASPELAAKLCADALAGGAAELLLRFDRLARHGVDPGTLTEADAERELFPFDAGSGGCAVYHAGALATVLAAVDLAGTPIALDAGAATRPALALLLRVAAERRVPRADLRLELGADPIHELAFDRPAWEGEPAAFPRAEVAAVLAMSEGLPEAVPFTVRGEGYHAAGATPAQELACVLATLCEYLAADDRLVARGGDAFALCLPVGTELFTEVAKLRAARLLAHEVLAAFGCVRRRVRIHAVSSARSWSTDDSHTNLLRSGIQCLAATLGGCDSIALRPFAQAHDARDRRAHALARQQQLLLREESLLHRVQDPCGGAHGVEALTDGIARAAFARFQEIERRGGMVAALLSGFVHGEIAPAAQRREQEVRTRHRVLVGTTRFVDPRFVSPETAAADAAAITTAHEAYLARRALVPAVGADLVAAAASGATIGEMVDAARGVTFTLTEHELFAGAPDGAAFEALRELVAAAGLRVLPVLAGEEAASRARHGFAVDVLQVGGFTVLDPVPAPASGPVAVAADADAVVLCCDDASIAALLDRVRGDVPVVVVGKQTDALAAKARGFLHAGGDVYLALRSLYLALQPPDDGR